MIDRCTYPCCRSCLVERPAWHARQRWQLCRRHRRRARTRCTSYSQRLNLGAVQLWRPLLSFNTVMLPPPPTATILSLQQRSLCGVPRTLWSWVDDGVVHPGLNCVCVLPYTFRRQEVHALRSDRLLDPCTLPLHLFQEFSRPRCSRHVAGGHGPSSKLPVNVVTAHTAIGNRMILNRAA